MKLTRNGVRIVTALLALGIAGAALSGLIASRTGGSASAEPPARVAAPAPVVEQPAIGEQPAPEEVLVGVYVSNIQSVDPITNSFDADFYVWLRWKNPDIDPAAGVEVMNPHGAWGLVVTPVYPEPQRQTDGSLLWLARYQGAFNAPLSLSDYPFERQTLRIIVEDGVETTQKIVYRPDKDAIRLDPEVTLPGYHIGELRIDCGEFHYDSSFGRVNSTRADQTYPRITVSIPLASPAATGIVKVVLPIVVVLFAAALTLVVPVDHVDAKIGLAITALLALVAMHWGVSSTLAETGYLLMVDVLYLISYAMVTAILATSIAGVWVTRSRGEQAATVMERRMLVLTSAATVVSVVAVLLLYLS